MKVFDIETYVNFFLCVTYNPAKNEFKRYRINDRKQFLEDTKNEVMVSFNGKHFDNPILFKWTEDQDSTDADLYKLGQEIISNVPMWDLKNASTAFWSGHWRDHIDLITFFTDRIGLKQVAINCGSEKIQDLPYPPEEPLSESEKVEVMEYCENDCKVTFDVLKQERIRSDLKVRKYINENIEPFKSSETLSAFETSTVQIAEKFMMKSLMDHNNCKKFDDLPKADKTQPTIANCLRLVPEFKSDYFKQFMAEIQDVTMGTIEKEHLTHLTKNQQITLSKKTFFKKPMGGYKSNYFKDYMGKEYNFGLGGLHSKDAKKHWLNNELYQLVNVDVGSYYPSIIQKFGINPIPGFSKIEGDWKRKRYEFKDAGDILTSNTYKLMINSIFGKMNDFYSKLKSARSAFSVTITGQVLLLYLIEKVQENIRCKVVNANTDGVCFYIKRRDLQQLKELCSEWEKETQMTLDFDYVNHWIALGCNEYAAVIDLGNGKTKLKTKGSRFITKPKLDGKLLAPVVSQAVVDYFINGTDPATYIRQNATLENIMISSKSTKGFHTYADQQVQKSVRYYHSTVGKELKSGHGSKVAESAMLALDISQLRHKLPVNLRIDYKKYESMAQTIINEVLSHKVSALGEKSELAIINATATKMSYDFSVIEDLGIKMADLYPSKTLTSGYKGCGKKDAQFYSEESFIKGTMLKAEEALCYQLQVSKKNGFIALMTEADIAGETLTVRTKSANYLIFTHTGTIPQSRLKKMGFKVISNGFIPFFGAGFKTLNNEILYLSTIL